MTENQWEYYMSAALIAYVAWDRVVPWKILSLPEKEGATFFPIGYGSGQAVLHKRAEPGSQLWVLTIPVAKAHSPDRQVFPPTLVARIQVQALCSKASCPEALRAKNVERLLDRWTWVAVGDPAQSRFFELNDASPALMHLGIMEPGEPASLELARKFQSIRYLPEGNQVQQAFDEVDTHAQKKAVFISYTHAEGTQLALQLASELAPLGFHLWLDALTIPLYNVAKEDDCQPHRLRQLIRLGVQQTQLAIVLNTPAYAQKSDPCGFNWTQWEYDLIREKQQADAGLRCIQVNMGGTPLSALSPRFEANLPEALARAIAGWF